jgi:hypothetical protein
MIRNDSEKNARWEVRSIKMQFAAYLSLARDRSHSKQEPVAGFGASEQQLETGGMLEC